MATIEIVEVETTSQLKKFIAYPNHLYRDDPHYVAPLLSERLEFFNFQKNPFYRCARVKLFLAQENGQLKGRIATCVNYSHNEFHHEQVGFFGFFDCHDDYDVASKLLKVAMITLKREGMEKMRGPMNFSTNHECGFLIDGFDSPPMVMMTYNHRYLPDLAEKFGLKKVMDLLAYKLTKENPISERIQTVVDKMQRRSQVTVRNLNLSDFDNEVRRVDSIYRTAWEHNWGFVPMTEEEFFYMARQLRQIVDPNLVFIAENKNKPVAFSLALPDINQALVYLNGRLFPFGLLKLLWHTKIRNKIDGVRVVMLGVIPAFQKRGIDSMLYVATYRRGVQLGYTWAELSWILETNNLMRRAIEQMGGQVYKRYRIMEMPL